MADQLGLNLNDFNECYGSQDAQAAVAADSLLATQNGLSSTPSFLINGKPLLGAQPYDAFREAIEAELAGS
jgi:protein-disulfide isomerase